MVERLQSRRVELGLSLAELGRRVSLAASTLKNYETDRRQPTPHTLLLLAEALETSVDYLLGRTDDPVVAANTAVSPVPNDPQMAFGASLADGMSYDDLDPTGKAELYKYYQYLRERYPRK